jgi:L-aminopeptidase/D-esterase-like protein
VPIVPAAILFDLGLGRADVRPDAESGYRACLAASDGPVAQGSVGAGTGATVAKMLGRDSALKGGIGSASLRTGDGYFIGALFAVNASGDVVDPETGETMAGPRREDGTFHNSLEILQTRPATPTPVPATNTTIGVVATDAPLTKEEANKLAQMASSGMARALRPAHTIGDGDLLFALRVGEGTGLVNMTSLGALAAKVVERSIVQAVLEAKGLAGVPSAREWIHGDT